jgi:hypothetical protein
VHGVQAADAVEEGRLSGAVRSDESHNLALDDLKAHTVERRDPTELNAHVSTAQHADTGRYANQ